MDIYIYNEIVPGQEESIAKAIKNSKDDYINVHISSPGGAVYTGWTISNLIASSGKKTTALIEGFCASIATHIAINCDKVMIAPTAQFMIHSSSTIAEGNKVKLLKEAETLEKIDAELMGLYKQKAKIGKDKIKELMDAEYRMSAKEAIEFGFADGYMEELKAVARFEDSNELQDNMENNEVKEKLNIIVKMIKAFSKQQPSNNEPKNMVFELEEGGSVFIETEDESELTGKNVFLVDEEGNASEEPAPDGMHTLANGVTIVVEGGVITTTEETTEEEPEDQEKKELKGQVDELKAQIEAMKEEKKAAAKAEEETSAKIQALADQVEEFKNMAVGTEFTSEKPHVSPSSKGQAEAPAAETNGLDGLLNKIKQNYNG